MSQIMVAQTNVLVEGTGRTVEWKKAYMDTGGTWQLAGDAGADDPGTAVTIACSEGAQSTVNAGFYYYYGNIVTSYTYTLYVNTVAQAGLTGVMLFSMDLMPSIALNDTHRASDGSGHADVASNSVHAALVTTNPHGVDTSAANGVDLANVDDTSDATKNAAVVTLTNKTITSPKIDKLYNTGGTYYLRFPIITANGIIDQDADMLTKTEMVEELASGTENSITVLKSIYTQIMNSEKFAQMMVYAGFYSEGAGAPSTAPTRKLQFYLNTTNDDVYVAIGTSIAADWDLITTS